MQNCSQICLQILSLGKTMIVTAILGGWIIFDGIVSILIYRDQTLQEHLIRIVRVCVGSAIVLLSV